MKLGPTEYDLLTNFRSNGNMGKVSSSNILMKGSVFTKDKERKQEFSATQKKKNKCSERAKIT